MIFIQFWQLRRFILTSYLLQVSTAQYKNCLQLWVRKLIALVFDLVLKEIRWFVLTNYCYSLAQLTTKEADSYGSTSW